MTIRILPSPQPGAKKPKREWNATTIANLRRHRSGNYHVFAHVGGRLIRRSLNTKNIDVAARKLGDLLAKERALTGRLTGPPDKLTFGDLSALFRARVEMNPKLKQRSKDYRIETLEQIERVAPMLWAAKPGQISTANIEGWCALLRKAYSPTRFNGSLQTLRMVFQIAVEHGLIPENPVRVWTRKSPTGIPAAAVPLTPPDLPPADKVQAVLDYLDASPWSRRARVTVRLLLYTGARISAIHRIRREDVDLARNEIRIPAVKYAEEPQRVPIMAQFRPFLEKLLEEHTDGPLAPVKWPRKALAAACKSAGIATLTHHDFRHLFATRCLECGVDVKTVAGWLGHRDGGALLLRRYAHLRDQHSQQMGAKVRF